MSLEQLSFDTRTLAPDHFRNNWIRERCPRHREFAALTSLLDTREQVCVLCAQCPQCGAFGTELCTCTMGCPDQDRSGVVADWSEPYAGGRFGLMMEGELRCAAYDTSCRRGLATFSEGLSGPSGSGTGAKEPSLVWQYDDGRIVHYRCAPEAARSRFWVRMPHRSARATSYPGRTRQPVPYEVLGVTGLWVFVGPAWSAVDGRGVVLVEDRPILWKRLPYRPHSRHARRRA